MYLVSEQSEEILLTYVEMVTYFLYFLDGKKIFVDVFYRIGKKGSEYRGDMRHINIGKKQIIHNLR